MGLTASIEQERASLSAFLEMAEREGFDTAHQWYDTKGWVFFSPSTADCWRYWQAARRAPAVPVPQGWKLVPISPTQEQLRAGYWSGGGEIRLHEEWARKESYERMVQNAPMTSPAAAPQPPEAAQLDDIGVVDMAQAVDSKEEAPVQLPELAGWIDDGGMVFWNDGRKPNDGEIIYTEQQVRELLAAHGIEEQQ